MIAAAGVAAGATALQVPGAPGKVLAAVAAALGVGVPLAVDGPWKRSQARHERISEIIRQLPGGGNGRLPTVSSMVDVTSAAVHPSIPLPGADHDHQPTSCPAYIERDVDAQLHTLLTSGRNVFVILVGPSSAGKTRTTLHHLVESLGTWRLFWPASGVEFNEYVAASGNLRRIVVWLDNLTELLLTGQAMSVASINHVLQARQPTVIIGAVTPAMFDQITTSPPDAPYEVSSAARQILRMAYRIDLDVEFSPAEMKRATQLDADPRIAEALAHGESRLTEYLAAVPNLRTKWRHGMSAPRGLTPVAARVVTAAALCRLAGHPNPVPAPMLRDAALSLLTGKLKASVGADWFEQATQWAREPVRGDASLLTATADTPAGADAFYVHEAITQTVPTDHMEQTWHVTAEIWAIVTERCAIEIANRVGYAAATAGHLAEARAAWTKAADGGDLVAMYNLGLLLRDDGDTATAEEWLTRGAEAGGTEAMSGLGILLADADRAAESEAWLAKGAGAGNPIAMYNFAQLLYRQGQVKRARRWYEKAANYGLTEAIFNLGSILADSNKATDIQSAMVWLSRGAGLGDAACAFRLGSLWFEGKDAERAELYLRQAADAGHPAGMGLLGYLLTRTQRMEEAEEWLRAAAEAGHVASMLNLSNVLKLGGRSDESLRWADRWRAAAAETGISRGTQLSIQLLPATAGMAGKSGRSKRRGGR